MVYFLKKSSTRKKGVYLQIYESYYVPGKGGRNRSYKALGYVADLIEQGIKDPVAHFQKEVDVLNQTTSMVGQKEIGDASASKNIGYFLIKAMFDKLAFDPVVNLITRHRKFNYLVSDFIRVMTYAQIVNPGSKLKAYENVIPNIYGVENFSYDQILDGSAFLGEDYTKYIEHLNYQISKVWKRNYSHNYFDCTNYYFEIDLEKDDKQKGPSKENHRGPIISQALLLDGDQIPLGMLMFPGNESEKPQLRKMIEETKERYDIHQNIVQVADKGLNCAQNIHHAAVMGKDGYIFSRSVKGKSLSDVEKSWVLNDNDWKQVKDHDGTHLYSFKEWTDTFSYSFVDENGETIKFSRREKRVVTYSPKLARKQRAEISKELDKLETSLTVKKVARKELGDKVKYVNMQAFDENGVIVPIETSLNNEKISEAFKLAGYNLLVTSELKKSAREIYEIYHNLSKIEECFRITKSYLEARPVFLQKQESIYGHFLICYIALTILKLLEVKEFSGDIHPNQLVNFIRQFSITETLEGTYVNNASKSETHNKVQKKVKLTKLSALNLRKKDVENILNCEL